MEGKSIYALKNIEVHDSSSGAAFPTIESILRKKYTKLIVYGAAFDGDMIVRHFRANNEEETRRFRGSKYIESDISGIAALVEKDLCETKDAVLFTGTPCQVAGIRRYIQKKEIDNERLFLVDLLCHGTPSKENWKSYLRWLENKYKSKLIDFSFRKNGKIELEATFSNNQTIKNTHDMKMFYSYFNSPKMIQDKCFKCQLAGMKNESDITIGDFWGIDKVMDDFPYEEGVSIVIINSCKGIALFDEIISDANSKKAIIVKKCENKDVLKYNHPLRGPAIRTEARDRFLKDYSKGWGGVYRRYCLRLLFSKIKHTFIK